MNFKKIATFIFCGILSCSMATPLSAAALSNQMSSSNQVTISGFTSKTLNTKNTDANKDSSDKNVKWPKPPKSSALSCESAVVVDAATGMVLFEQNAHKKQYPASITKIMTSLVALENSSLGETVTFSHDAVFGIEYGSSNVAAEEGEKFTMEQCLYAIMLESANEVCLGVAEHIAGDIPSYVNMMNDKVKELGLKDTHFANPNGLHNDKHYTSAYDMAMISKEALKNSTFRKITGTKNIDIPPTNKKKETRHWMNHHDMLSGRRYPRYMTDDCFGGKTGYTSMAKSTLVTFQKRNDMELICVVMRANGVKGFPNFNQYTDTQKLLDYAFENYTSYEMSADTASGTDEESGLFTKFNPVFDSKVSPIHLGEDGKVVLPNGAKLSDTKQTVTYNTDTPLQDGENKIGQAVYTYGGKTVGSTNIYFTKSSDTPVLTQDQHIQKVKSRNIRSKTQRTALKWATVIVAIVIIAAIAIGVILFKKKQTEETSVYSSRKRPHKRRRKN